MEDERSKLYVGGLSKEINVAALIEYFSQYCEVKEASIIPGEDFGFVTLIDQSMTELILAKEHIILGKKVIVNRARPRNNSVNASLDQYIKGRIFVGGLPSGVTEEEFKECFEKFGKILQVVLLHEKEDRKPRGFGFITFDSDEAVERVVELQFLPLKDKLVEVKRAEPKPKPMPKPSNFDLASPFNYSGAYYYDSFAYPSFYYPVTYYYTWPYSYNQYVYEVGGPSTAINGGSFGSSSFPTRPYNISYPTEQRQESRDIIRIERSDESDDSAVTKEDESVKLDEGRKLEQIGGDHENGGGAADKSVKNGVDDLSLDGLSLSCNGGNGYAHCNGNSKP